MLVSPGSGFGVVGELHRALAGDRGLLLHYQTKIDLKRRRVSGVEALVRWEQPSHHRIRVVVEGVETAEQAAWLSGSGCDEAQGYYFSHPLPAEEMSALLHGGQGSASSD